MSAFKFKSGDAVQHKSDVGRHTVKFIVIELVAEFDDAGNVTTRCYWLRGFTKDGRLASEYARECELEPWVEPACCKLGREVDVAFEKAAALLKKPAEPYTPSPPEAAKTQATAAPA